MTRSVLLLALSLALACHAAPSEQAADRSVCTWDFAATLDGKPIGTHHFVVSGPDMARAVDSHAQFVVRLLGIPVYRYRHQAEEHWQGDCLRELRSDTDDDGKREQVLQRYDDECLMGFAYWNPNLLMQQRLVDPQTGRIESVRFERLPDQTIDVRGTHVPAQGWRLLTDRQRIDIWYAADSHRWIALDADAKGGRRLSYRQPQEAP